MSNKKILIISSLFAPQNRIGALRPTKIAKYLLDFNIEMDILTRNDENDNGQQVRLLYNIKQTDLELTSKIKSNKKEKKGIHKLDNILINVFKKMYRTYLYFKDEKKYEKETLEFLNTQKININEYDSIFTTFGPISSILLGIKLKSKYKGVRWICDFRDPMTVKQFSAVAYIYMKYLQFKACSKADAIVAVSNGYLKRICKGKYSDKSYMIPNGYDKDDFIPLENCTSSGDVLILTYVGVLYEGKRDLSPLFCVLNDLINENIIDENKIVFNYAGNEFPFLLKQAVKYNMEKCVVNLGILSRQECLKVQFSSHFLILSTWNNKGEEGVFPGKFLEYMLVKKPIISVVDGNLSGSEVTEVMNEGNLGVSYEAANSKIDYGRLKEYIKLQYLNFIESKQIIFEPNEDIINRYDYNNIIKQIERIL